MSRKFTPFLILSLIFALSSCTPNDSIQQAMEQSVQQFEQAGVQNMGNDALFVAEAASANMLQVQLAALAEGQAVSPEVKNLAQRMLSDHGRMTNELQSMASQSNFVLPAELGAAHQKTYDNVASRSGLPFDLSYIKTIVEESRTLLKRHEDLAENGQTMEVKQYASRQVPLLQQHLQLAEALGEKVRDI
ncbi:DUF4142 domain-containing protein [Pontibacter beigongshangensis]|uniref:DUF4142 domain-containing protein n=1 Tax=Pontibacter beigongshangensis TaxID=2574733 RepID=UPI001650746E|nr:DUF4142 domain-containing protein [Pontibacter beigongshangensis]